MYAVKHIGKKSVLGDDTLFISPYLKSIHKKTIRKKSDNLNSFHATKDNPKNDIVTMNTHIKPFIEWRDILLNHAKEKSAWRQRNEEL